MGDRFSSERNSATEALEFMRKAGPQAIYNNVPGLNRTIRSLVAAIDTLEAEDPAPQVPPPGPMDAPNLSTCEAASYLGLDVSALRKWRYAKTGPRYRVVGKRTIRYSMADLDAFTRIVEPKENSE